MDLETLISERANKAELGRSIPGDFLGDIVSDIADILDKWLSENGAPETVRDLVQFGLIMARNQVELDHGEINDWDAVGLAENIPLAAKYISELRTPARFPEIGPISAN